MSMEQQSAQLIRHAAFWLHFATIAPLSQLLEQLNKEMTNPRVGHWVAEISDYGSLKSDARNAVGILLRHGVEPEILGPDEEWDVATDGPWPQVHAWYIKTLAGIEARWVNCQFVRIPAPIGDENPTDRFGG